MRNLLDVGTCLSDLEPVSTQQGYQKLHRDRDINNRRLELPYGPYTVPIRIIGAVGGQTVELQQAGGLEVYEHTFDGFAAREHPIRR